MVSIALETGSDLLLLETGVDLLLVETLAHTATSIVSLPSLSFSGTNAQNYGPARLTLKKLGFAAVGTMKPVGTATLTLPSLSFVARNTVALTLPSLSASAVAVLQPTGSLTATLPGLTTSATSANLKPGAKRVELRSYHGTTPVGTNILNSTLSFKWAKITGQGQDYDYTLNAADDAIVVPEAGATVQYSLVKNLRAEVVASPNYWIGNFRLWFSPRTRDWNGVHIYVTTSNAYVNALTQSPNPLTGFVNNVGAYTQSNPLALSGYFYVPNLGALTDWIQIQARVTANAEAGLPEPLEMHLEWDEWEQL